MSEYYKYLNEIINSTYTNLEPIISSIRKIEKCPNCSGQFINSKCKYCGTKNEELESLINRLESILAIFIEKIENLPIKQININKLFNLLYSIDNVEISIAKSILEKYNYQKLYLDFLEQTLNRLNNFDVELSQLEVNVIETEIYRNENKNMEAIFDLFIHNALFKKQNVSFECFCKLIEHFTEHFMKNFYHDSKCTILEQINNKNDVVGGSAYNQIFLDEQKVKNLFYNGDIELIWVIFHELTHTMQYSQIFTKASNAKISPFTMDELKEYILCHETDWYHDENYDVLTYEYEADFYGLYLMQDYLNKINCKINNEITQKKMEDLQLKMQNRNRIKNGEPTTIDNEFDNLIYNRPDLLNKYNQLNYLYKIEEMKVMPKTQEELIRDSQNILDNPNISNEFKEMISIFYENYISLNRI